MRVKKRTAKEGPPRRAHDRPMPKEKPRSGTARLVRWIKKYRFERPLLKSVERLESRPNVKVIMTREEDIGITIAAKIKEIIKDAVKDKSPAAVQKMISRHLSEFEPGIEEEPGYRERRSLQKFVKDLRFFAANPQEFLNALEQAQAWARRRGARRKPG